MTVIVIEIPLHVYNYVSVGVSQHVGLHTHWGFSLVIAQLTVNILTQSKKRRDVGKIILLNTPIGNLGDITPRVSEALKAGEQFAVEDTRVFKELLNHLGISLNNKRVFSLHDQSEKTQVSKLLELTRSGDLYVASEAGSPIISDPAYPLVVEAYEQGIEVDSYSGISSPVMALELSGLPPIPFHFHGFLPRESGKRTKIFQDAPYGTNIYFEAPTRIAETMKDLMEADPEAQVCLVRELTKKFQECLRFRSKDWPEIHDKLTIKGEFILLFYQESESKQSFGPLKELASEYLSQKGSSKTLAKILGHILDRPTKEIYSELAQIKKEEN